MCPSDGFGSCAGLSRFRPCNERLRSLGRFDAGDRSFVCGRYWDDSWCQKDVQVIPAAERQKLFNTKGSCLAWRNLTSGQEFVQGPNEKMRIAGSIAKAASEAAKKEASKHSKGRRR